MIPLSLDVIKKRFYQESSLIAIKFTLFILSFQFLPKKVATRFRERTSKVLRDQTHKLGFVKSCGPIEISVSRTAQMF